MRSRIRTRKVFRMRSREDDEAERGEVHAAALHAAAQALGFGTLFVSPNGKVLDIDERACALTGRTREEFLALDDFMVCIAPEERHRITDRRRARREGPLAPAVVNSVLLRPDGTRVPVQWATAEIGRETGDLRLAAVLRDTTQEVNTQRLAHRYQRLIDSLPLAVLVWDTSGVDDPLDMRLVSANGAARAVLAPLEHAEVGQRVGDLFADAVRDAARTIAVRGTGTVEHFPDLLIGDPERPQSVHRRRAVDLGDDLVAFMLENVTGERVESMRRRRLLERLVDTGDDERRNIALAVHDEPIQQLAAATLLVEALRRNPDSEQRDLRLEAVEQSLRAAMSELRRLVFELSPPELVESGLRGALDSAAAYLFDGTDTVVTLDVTVPDEPHLAAQTAAFRIAAEALANTRRHADASHVLVDLHVQDGLLYIDIDDNGHGFTLPIPPGRVGLRTMRERSAALGGEFDVESGPDGTHVHAVVPLGGRQATANAAFDANLAAAAAAAAPSSEEIETLRQERDSLRFRNDRQYANIAILQQRLERTLALWATLDDPTLEIAEQLRRTVRHVADLCADGCGLRLVSADGTRWDHTVAWHPDPEQRAFLDRSLVLHAPDEASRAHRAPRQRCCAPRRAHFVVGHRRPAPHSSAAVDADFGHPCAGSCGRRTRRCSHGRPRHQPEQLRRYRHRPRAGHRRSSRCSIGPRCLLTRITVGMTRSRRSSRGCTRRSVLYPCICSVRLGFGTVDHGAANR